MITGCTFLIGEDGINFGTIPHEFFSALVNNDVNALESLRHEIEHFDLACSARAGATQADLEDVVKEIPHKFQVVMEDIYNKAVKYGCKMGKGKTLRMILDAFQSADETQVQRSGPIKPSQTYEETYKKVSDRLDASLKEIFGETAGNVRTRLMRKFSDSVARRLIYDDTEPDLLMRLKLGTNDVTETIWDMRAEMYGNMVGYLKYRFPDDDKVQSLKDSLFSRPDIFSVDAMRPADVYMAAMLFKKLVLENNDFKNRYADEVSLESRNNTKSENERQYREIMEIMSHYKDFLKEYGFIDKEGNLIKTAELNRFSVAAYEGDNPSRYTRSLYDYIEKNNLEEGLEQELGYDPLETLDRIIYCSDSDLVTAVSDYMGLMHFDNMLETALGDYIVIDGNVRDKMAVHRNSYRRNKGGSGNKKQWGESDSIDAAKYTTQKIKAILGLFGVYDYYNPSLYWNQRLSPEKVTFAFHKVRNGLLNGRYEIDFDSGEDGSGKEWSETSNKRYFMNRLAQFSDNPQKNMIWFFTQMFGRPEKRFGTESPMVSTLRERTKNTNDALTQLDINILYSFYRAICDINTGLLNVAMGMHIINPYGYSVDADTIMNTVARYLITNNEVRYLIDETGYDGDSKLSVLAKFVSNYDIADKRNTINAYANGIAINKRRELQDRYGYNFTKDPDKNNITIHSMSLMDGTELRVTTSNVFGLMFGDENVYESELSIRMSPKGDNEMAEFWKAIDEVSDDMIDGLINKIDKEGLQNFDPESITDSGLRKLYYTFSMLDDFLDLSFTSDYRRMLSVYKYYRKIFQKNTEFETCLMPLVKMAFRSAYANNKYILAEDSGMTLSDYLRKKGDDLMDAYFNKMNKERTNYLHIGITYDNGIFSYNVMSRQDKMASNLVLAENIFNGKGNETTFVGFDGNKRPNASVSNNIDEIHNRLSRLTPYDDRNLSRFRFLRLLLSDQVHAYQVSTKLGSVDFKSIGKGDVYIDAIINRFFNSLSKKGKVMIQPTAYSDKGTTVFFELDLNKTGELGDFMKIGERYDGKVDYRDEIIKKTSVFFRKYYNDLYNNTVERLHKALAEFAKENAGNERGETVAELLASNSEENFYQALKTLTVSELADSAKRAGVDVIEDLDYKVVRDHEGNVVLVGNELLRGYKRLYGDADALGREIKRYERDFLSAMLAENVSFRVIDSWDSLKYHTGTDRPTGKKNSTNGIYNSLEWFLNSSKRYVEKSLDDKRYMLDDKIKFNQVYYRDWVDEETGRLILAKQKNMVPGEDGENAREVTINIMSSLDFDVSRPFTLNPFLEYYNIVQGSLKRALDIIVSGTDAGDRVKGNAFFNEAIHADRERLRDDFGIESEEDIDTILETNARIDCVDDLGRMVERIENSDVDTGFSDEVKKYYNDIYMRSILISSSAAQSQHYKRAGAEVSTRQLAVRSTIPGVLNEINVAVFEPLTAQCYNFNGEVKNDVDVMEGGVYVTPNQNRSENSSFTDHRLAGIHAKPMINNIGEDGTKQYVKYASTALTNNMMRTNDHMESGISVRNLFKKMTNIQWDTVGLKKNYRITRNYLKRNDSETDLGDDSNYVNDVLFENRPIYYVDGYDNRYRIDSLGNEELNSRGWHVYYTVESDGNFVGDKPPADYVDKVYHLFYDDPETGKKSLHIRFFDIDDYKNEYRKLEEEGKNPHTINSNYELHTALGGMWCVDSAGRYSEDNNDVVWRICNYTVVPRGRFRHQSITQENYDQPLKRAEIHYIMPKSTMKQGAANINPVRRLYSDNVEDLVYMGVSTEGLGLQQDPGKSVDESTDISLSTQLVGALGNNGVVADRVNHLYKIIGQRIEYVTKKVVDAVKNIDNPTRLGKVFTIDDAKKMLYNIMGEIFINNYKQYDYQEIVDSVLGRIKKEFFKSDTHDNDKLGIPFSDTAFYERFTGTLSNYITSAIKMRLTGAGLVLAPSYDMVKVYDARILDHKTGEYKNVVLMWDDIVRKANREYKNELIDFIIRADKELTQEERDNLGNEDLQTLEDKALKSDKTGNFSDYFTRAEDDYEMMEHRKGVWLKRHAVDSFTTQDRAYFVPGETVEVLDSRGEVYKTIELSAGKTYADFIEGRDEEGKAFKKGSKYRVCTVRSRNLKPVTIRWKYMGKDGVEHWMNYFALPHALDAMTPGGTNPRSLEYKMRCENVLNDLYRRRFHLKEGDKEYTQVVGKFEKTHAENVISNQYGNLFGIRPGDSMAEVLEQGRDYFYRAAENSLRAPVTVNYDIAFLRDDGKHTLVKFSDPNSDITLEKVWDKTVTDGNQIWVSDGNGNRQFVVGRWVRSENTELSISPKGTIINPNGISLEGIRLGKDQNGNPEIQERIDLVKRYVTVVPGKDSNGRSTATEMTLLRIADEKDFIRAYYNRDYYRSVISQIIGSIYGAGNYTLAEMNGYKLKNGKKKGLVRDVFDTIVQHYTVTGYERELHQYQSNMLKGKGNWKGYQEIKERWYNSLADERWTCFQDSTKYISSRIPASGMQSFMTMQTVGWTGTDDNTAFVSHFQIYLQGSDFDVDKANMLGQNYDHNGKYIGWSPYFDYTSLATLEASKTLPVPLDLKLSINEKEGADITEHVRMMAHNSTIAKGSRVFTTEGMGEETKVNFLNALSEAMFDINTADGKFFIDRKKARISDKMVEAAWNTLIKHNSYKIAPIRYLDAIDNAIHANIWEIASDIRNMVSAYTATTTERFENAATQTPRGRADTTKNNLNTLNTESKHVDAKNSKRIVSIAANANKVFDYAYQYVTQVLKGGDAEKIRMTQFSAEIDGIEGRASGRPVKRTINHMPDLNTNDEVIREAMREVYGIAKPEKETKARVKDSLSEYINCATDDDKLDNILNKIRCVPQTGSLYGTLISLGFSIEDTVAFMTSPLMDNVATFASKSIFTDHTTYGNIKEGIAYAIGKVNPKSFLHGMEWLPAEEYFEARQNNALKTKERSVMERFLRMLGRAKDSGVIVGKMRERLGIDEETDLADSGKGLGEIVQAFVMSSAESPWIEFKEGQKSELLLFSDVYGEQYDYEIKSFVNAVDESVKRVRKMLLDYTEEVDYSDNSSEDILSLRCRDGIRMLDRDIKALGKVNRISNSMTTLAVAYLSLNQGVPYSDIDIVKKKNNMNRLFNDLESDLDINDERLYGVTDTADIFEMDALIDRIVEENPHLAGRNEPEKLSNRRMIKERIDEAHKAGIINRFDIGKAMADVRYRNTAIRYLDVIKEYVNTLDLVYKLPHYRSMIESFYAQDRTLSLLSVRKRLLDKYMEDRRYVDNKTINSFKRWSDKIITLDYFVHSDAYGYFDNIITTDGFDADFNLTKVRGFDLTTDSGQAGFCKWITEEFLDYLKDHDTLSNNSFVKALTRGTKEGRTILTTKYDMLNPNATDETRDRFDDMVIGLQNLSEIRYEYNNRYSIGDILFLYNLVENSNAVDRKSLSTAFRGVDSSKGVMSDYYNYISEVGRDTDYVPEYDEEDYNDFVAPKVNIGSLIYQTANRVKVEDNNGSLSLYQRNIKYNEYYEVDMNKSIKASVGDTDDTRLYNMRMSNYMRYAPTKMQNMMDKRRSEELITGFNYGYGNSDAYLRDLKNLLINYSFNGKVQYQVIC